MADFAAAGNVVGEDCTDMIPVRYFEFFRKFIELASELCG